MDRWCFDLAPLVSNEHTVIRHLRKEWRLLSERWLALATPAAFLLYGITFIARNIASYRNCLVMHHGRLADAGFDLLPELPQSLKELPHGLTLMSACIAGGLCGVQLCRPKDGIYVTNILIRFGRVMTLGHAVRALLYLSTSLPAPADHCIAGALCFRPPSNWYDIFFGFYPKSCGDLLFSGHVLTTCVLTLVTQRYAAQILGSGKVERGVRTTVWLLFAAVGPLIIAARNHYTVDVLAGYIISPLLWREYEAWFPTDT